MIPDTQKDKLIKVLNLTTSNHDGEALNAIRLANAIIKEAKLNWASVIERLSCQHCVESMSIDIMIDAVKKNSFAGSWANDFVSAVEVSYKKNRRLTPRQTETLKRVYESNK